MSLRMTIDFKGVNVATGPATELAFAQYGAARGRTHIDNVQWRAI